jgi:hypothetical protein
MGMDEVLFTVSGSDLIALFVGFFIGWFGIFCLGRW